MAISFTCPFCNEAYNNLKEELIGKRVTCRNTSCRKIFVVKPNVPVGATASSNAATSPAISSPVTPASTPAAKKPIAKPAPIPKPQSSEASPPVDVEAMALQAFADEPVQQEVVQEKLSVTCTICDITFEVDRSMEGRNVPCPECRKLIKVPLIKKEAPVDWRKTENRDHLKKDLPKLEGVTEKANVSADALVKAGAIPKIEYEPLPISVKVKRALILLALFVGIGAGVVYLLNARSAKTEDKNLTEAIAVLEKSEEAKTLTDLQAGLYRLAAEERLRTAQTKADLDEAVKFLNTARDRVMRGSDHVYERQAALVEIASTYCLLGGTPEQLNKEVRLRWDDVQKHVRQTLEKIGDDELRKIGIQRITRELAVYQEAARAIEVAKQIFATSDLPEVIGIVGMELMRIGKKEAASELLKKKASSMVDATGVDRAPSLTALRLSLGTLNQPAPLNNLGVIRSPDGNFTEEGRQAYVEAMIFAGDTKSALELANRNGIPQSRLRTYLLAAEKLLLDNATEQAAPFLEGARLLVLREGKGPSVSPWLKVRCVHLLAWSGKADQANEVIETLDKEIQPWARVEWLRGRLLAAGSGSADESWVLPAPEGTKLRLAHGVARELFSRHQAANGYSVPVDSLSPLLKPFAQLAVLLGNRGVGVANRE